LIGEISIVGRSGGCEDDLMGEFDVRKPASDDVSWGIAIWIGRAGETINVDDV